AAGLALVLATLGIWWSRAPAPIRRDADLDVLLITIDTLRADALGCYGNASVETPWIDGLAGAGVRFASAHAQNVVTLPSHANILSGRYPLDHGVRDNAGFRFPRGTDTLATLLSARGYHTGAFVSAFPLDSRFGLDRGFDVYDDQLGDPDVRTAFLMPERPGARTVALARQWREAQGAARTFTWLHLYEPHFPYTPPEPFATRYAQSPYHGEVAYADSLLGPVLEPLLRAGRDGRTLVILTGDHGEGLGEHGEKTHGIFAYDTTLHVPLVLYAPRLFGARTVADRVRHIDILPTVLDALGLAMPPGLPGRSLLPLAVGRREDPAPSYFEALSSSLNRGWAPLTGLAEDRLKFIDLPIPELYDLDADPHETKNLAAVQTPSLEALRGRLDRLRASDQGIARAAETAEAREQLRSLGYASTSAPGKAHHGQEDDPKRLIGLDDAIQDVVTLFQSGRLDQAIARVKDVLAQRPDMPLALQHLAYLQRQTGDLAGAVATLQRSLALHADDTESAALLGAYLNESGHAREAAAVLGAYAARQDPDLDILMARGAALAQVGRIPDAVATFERALAIDPSNAVAKANLGTVYLGIRDYARARSILEEALVLDPDVSRAHNALGVIAAETGRPEEAITHWKRAVELNPKEWDTVYNLGLLLRKQNHEAEARTYFERFVRGAPAAQYGEDIRKLKALLGA
ncbi:MAG TPA: sulfatase-like hydrolase/transferase, partial [Vicinamibacteria bacterium]|nr:sulfatase-like hydrolase/transferase [Vicinamibacteria bacterium]